jgi:hypothetical protein
MTRIKFVAGPARTRKQGKQLSRRKSVCWTGVTVMLPLTGGPHALAQSVPPPAQDGMLKNGPPAWDANHDGVYTCDEWKRFADRILPRQIATVTGISTRPSSQRSKKPTPHWRTPISVILTKTRTARSRARSSSRSRTHSSCGSTETATVVSLRMKSERQSPRRVRRARLNGPGTGFIEV